MNANAVAIPAGAAWEEDTAPEAPAGLRAARVPSASPVVAAARKGILFVLGSLVAMLAGLAVLAYLI